MEKFLLCFFEGYCSYYFAQPLYIFSVPFVELYPETIKHRVYLEFVSYFRLCHPEKCSDFLYFAVLKVVLHLSWIYV